MKLSVSIQQTPEGYVPRLVLEVPRSFQIIPVGNPCSSFKEAWIVSRTAAKTKQFEMQVKAEANA